MRIALQHGARDGAARVSAALQATCKGQLQAPVHASRFAKYVCTCVCVCVRVYACVRCAFVCVSVCVRACAVCGSVAEVTKSFLVAVAPHMVAYDRVVHGAVVLVPCAVDDVLFAAAPSIALEVPSVFVKFQAAENAGRRSSVDDSIPTAEGSSSILKSGTLGFAMGGVAVVGFGVTLLIRKR